jgi:hypothetical protein
MSASVASARMESLSAPPVCRSPLAQEQRLAQSEAARDVGQGVRVDDGGAHLREPALGFVREAAVQVLGDDDPQHGVAQELEALVVRGSPVLERPGSMRQGKPYSWGSISIPSCVKSSWTRPSAAGITAR